MTEPSAAARVWRSRLLGYLDGHAADMVADLADLVRVPSISGSAEENAIQDVLSARLAGDGLDVDAWPIPMAETLAAEASAADPWLPASRTRPASQCRSANCSRPPAR